MLLCDSLTTPTISHQEASACYVKAFLAPVSWTTLITQSDNNIDLNDYDALLWAAKPALQNMPSSTINLPSKAGGQKMKKMCVFFICLAHFLHCLVSFSFFFFFKELLNCCWFQDEDAPGSVWSHVWQSKDPGGQVGKRADGLQLLQLHNHEIIWPQK